MAFTYVRSGQSVTNYNVSPAGQTAVFTMGGAVAVGDTLFVYTTVATDITGSNAQVTDNLGNTYNWKKHTFDTTNSQSLDGYVAVVTVAGTPTITFDPTGGANIWIAAGADHFTGTTASSAARDAQGQFESNPGTGTDAVDSTSLAAQSGDLLWGVSAAGGSTTTEVIGTGFTAAKTIDATVGWLSEFKTASGAGAATFTDATNGTLPHFTIGIAVTTGAGPLGRRPAVRVKGPQVRRFLAPVGPPPNWRASTAAVGTTVLPGLGSGTWDAFAPTVVIPNTVPIGLGQATWTGLAPTATVSVVTAPGVGAATWTGLAPTVVTPNTIPIGLGQATWTGLAPTVQISIVVAPGVGAATWTGLAPTVVTTNNIVVTSSVGAALWQGIAPSLPGFGVVAVGGRRPKAQYPQRRTRTPHFEMAEDQLCRPGVGTLAIRGLRPRVEVTNIEADDRFMLKMALDDEDMAMALTMADAWMD